MHIIGVLKALGRNIGYALRTMRRQPAFALTAMATLGLGIGANTTIFSVINTVLLKPLDYQDPGRLVRISGGATEAKFSLMQTAHSFAGVGAFTVYNSAVTLSLAEASEGLTSVRVSFNFLSLLGVKPLAGRTFLPADQQPGSAKAMISADLWHRRFSSDPAIANTPVRLGGVPFTIVGVLPPGFHFPSPDIDIWIPLQPDAMPAQARLNSPGLAVFGRLREGVGFDRASTEIALLNRQYALAHPEKLDAKTGTAEALMYFKDQLVRGVRPTLWMLTGAVGLVLAIACSNFAGLLIVRWQTRSRELAVRAALGASRARVVSQLLTESILLAVGGGALGIAGSVWALRGIDRLPGLEIPRLEEIQMDGTVLGFGVALSIVTGIVFGLVPLLTGLGRDLLQVVKGGSETQLRTRIGPRSIVVVLQVAFSVVLLVGAVLLIESVARLRRVDPGFNADHLLTMRLALPPEAKPSTAGLNFDELVARVESIPGVRHAAITLTLPTTGFAGTPVHAIGQTPPPLNKRPIAILQSVTPGYFRTMGIAVRRGREFSTQDSRPASRVVILNEAMARRFWPSYPGGEDPIGRPILAGASQDPLQIVGIVADVRQAGLAIDAAPGIYRPRAQTSPMSAMFAVRTIAGPKQVVQAVRAAVTATHPDLSIMAVKTMTEVLDESESQRRLVMILLALFAGTGLLLTGVGTYGLIAYSVTIRTREIGIRKALGAQSSDTLKLVLGQGLALTVAGLVLGLGGAFALSRLLRSLLFEVSATDPAIFIGVALLCLCVSFVASYFPARRALRLDPSAAVRSDHP